MQKILAKRTSETINLFPHNTAMTNTISKTEYFDKAKDLINMLRGEKYHHLHAQRADDTLISLDKIHEVFEPLTKKYEIAASLNPNQITCEPQPPRV